MTLVKIFDYLSVAALGFMSYGILRQWWHVYKTKSVRDIVATEVVIRCIITLVLLVKLFLVGDAYLIIGQILLAIVILIYTVTLLILKNNLQRQN